MVGNGEDPGCSCVGKSDSLGCEGHVNRGSSCVIYFPITVSLIDHIFLMISFRRRLIDT